MRYSIDTRKIIIEYLESGHTQREARDTHLISLNAINRWHRLFVCTGELNDLTPVRKHKKLPPDKLRAYIAEHPDAYLQEIADEFSCSDTAVGKALKRHGITRKKNEALRRAKT
jgi:transposase